MTTRPFRFGVVAAQAGSATAWTGKAQRAESLGYSTFLIPDFLGPSFSPLPALAFVATVADMADQLIDRRERLGISYLTLADDMMEEFAPVVARLAGH